MDANEDTPLFVLSPSKYKGIIMEKYINKYLLKGILLAFGMKLLLSGISLSDMGVMLGLIAVVGLQEWLDNKRDKQMQQVIDTVNQQNQVIAKIAAEVADAKTQISTIKLNAGFKKVI